ncbi:MAG: alpha/beta fold hydrolase [Caulobacterales bacterium]
MTIAEQRFHYSGDDGERIAAFRWASDAPAKAVIQIAHGAGEHSLRYREPLTPIIEAGYLVYSADHRGHGATAGSERLGDFGPGGAPAAIGDMATLSRLIREREPDLPLVLLGHSMGAMFSQVYVLDHSDLIDALVLSGTAGPGPSPSQGPNAAFANPRTDYDWLSRNEAEVDKYVADPLCGIRFTDPSRASFTGLRERRIVGGEALGKVRKDLPIYVFVGDEDPINQKLARISPLIDGYKAAGLTDVMLKVYPGGRHEMLNETNRDEVVTDLEAWLDRAVAGTRAAA